MSHSNKFKFKKGDIEFEFEGEKDFVETQIKEWKPEIFSLLQSQELPKELEITPLEDLVEENKRELPFSISSLNFDSEIQSVEQSVKTDDTNIISDKEISKPTLSLNDIVNSIAPREIKVTKKITFEDFMALKEPESNEDKVMVAAYFLEKYEKQSSFNESDVYKLLLIESGEKYILLNVDKGYLIEYDKSGDINNYTLTYNGENYVREGLQSQ